jgi:hypothetical protein
MTDVEIPSNSETDRIRELLKNFTIGGPMKLIQEWESKTKRGNPCRVTVRQNHHGYYEALILIREGLQGQYFSCYDQKDQEEAVAVALARADEAGY